MKTTLKALLVLGGLAAGAQAVAAEIKVLTAGAYKPVVTALVPEFEKRTGQKVIVDNDTVGLLLKRVAAGETFDAIALTPAAIEQLTRDGKVVAGSSTRLGRVAIGVAVRRGDPVPDVSTVAAFRQTLMDAKSVAYIDPASGGSSGVYLSQLFEKWGILAQIKPKAVLVFGGLVAERLVDRKADLALHQISEIIAVPGVTLVGPLPAEIQNYTVYAGGLSTTARDASAARAFLDMLASPRAREVLKEKGMEAAP